MTVTLEEVDALAQEVKELNVKKKALEAQAKEVADEYNKKAFKLINIMKDHERKVLEGGFGRVTLVSVNYYKITDYDKAMQWLKDDGTYESLRKVTAADFSKRVKEVAEVDGPNKTKIVNPELVPVGAELAPREHLRIT